MLSTTLLIRELFPHKQYAALSPDVQNIWTPFALVLQSLLLAKELAVSWVSCSMYIGASMHAFSGQKSRDLYDPC